MATCATAPIVCSMAAQKAGKKSVAGPSAEMKTNLKQLKKDATLLEKEAAASAAKNSSQGKKSKKNRSFQSSVSKALHDNFIIKGFEAASMDLLTRDGMTIREIVTEAELEHERTKTPIGKLFYSELRSEFSSQAAPKQVMKVNDPNEPEDPRTSEAILGLIYSEYTLADAIFDDEYIPPNQKNMKCLFAALLDVTPSTEKGATFLLRALKYIMKSNLHALYPELWAALKGHMDRALDKSFVCMKSAGLPASMWLEKHHTYLHLVADEPAIRACVETKNSWEEVASQLSVAIQSACGMRIFGSRLGVVSCIAMSKKIDDEVKRFSQGDMTEASVKQAMATIKEACKDLGKDWTAPRASDGKIMYKYRGVDCLTKVTSHQQEALLKLIAEVRTRAINCKLLDPIWCECQLVDVNAAEKKTVAPSLLTDAKLVRKAAAELISGGSGAEIKKCLNDRNKLLLGMDKHWVVERDFWLSMIGQPGEDRMQKMLLAALPAANRQKTVEAALAEVEAIEKSKLFEFVGVGCQKCVGEVSKVLKALAAKRTPEWPEARSAFMSTCMDRVAAFCRAPVPPPAAVGSDDMFEDAAGEELVGKAALQQLLHTAQQDASKNVKLDMGRLLPFRLFEWLLSEEDRKKADALLTDVVGGISAGKAAHSKKGSEAKKETVDVQKRVAAKRKLGALLA